jgi:alpha-beta hydrolase superfamily lysophospholipase
MQERTFERAGKKIFYRLWDEVENPKGIVQIAHGMVEHTLRYDEVAKHFNGEGYIVVADEHRGHGRTDPDSLGYCAGNMFEDTAEDMHKLLTITKAEYPSLPYILFGFSYGSFLTQYFIGKYGKELDGIIIGGSSKNSNLSVSFGGFVAGMGATFKGEEAPAKLIKKLTFGMYDRKFKDRCFLSVNKESNEKYFADPYCTYICSHHFYRSFFGGLKKLYTKEYTKNVVKDVPILIVSGEDDPVGDMGKGAARLYAYYKKIGCKDVQLTLYPDARHEFLNEDIGRVRDLSKFCDRVIAKE